MKGFIKGLIAGCIITAAVCTAPVMANNISVLFNEVRININGTDRIQWGENIELADGTSMPSSILYNGTTYLPLRKMGELMNKQVSWNGDSKTVSVTDTPMNYKDIAQKEDANGNLWKYYTFTANGKNYLAVSDEVRGYRRVYSLANSPDKAMNVTNDAIYFIGTRESQHLYGNYHGFAAVVKIDFSNTPDTQDGEVLYEFRGEEGMLDGDFVYCMTYSDSARRFTYFNAINYVTGASNSAMFKGNYISNIHITQSDDDSAIVEYEVPAPVETGAPKKIEQIEIDKKTLWFNGSKGGKV